MAQTKVLQKFNDEKAIEWIPKGEKEKSRPIPLTIYFTYKLTEEYVELKERCSLRGDRMRPGIHYDPQAVSCPTSEKLSARLLFSMAAWHCMTIEHVDIFNSYVHKNSAYAKPVHLKEPRNSDGQYPHGFTIGLLKKNTDSEWTKAPDTNPPNNLSVRDTTKMIASVRSAILRGIPD